MRYEFLDQTDERLIELSELPREGGIAVALRTTGYDAEEDEIVELSICDLQGNTVFAHKVKPQNVETWDASEASGGIAPEDVQDEPELYQFEEEISDIFDKAAFVVALHVDFMHAMIERSWVTLPKYDSFDLLGEFCKAHSTQDQPYEPAPVASLADIAEYYHLPAAGETPEAEARTAAAAYAAFVDEQARERQAKGQAYWDAYNARKEQERRADHAYQEAERIQEIKRTRLNAILWLAAAVIFGNLCVQMGIRGINMSIVVVVGAVAVFLTLKWIATLGQLAKLSKPRK